MTDTPKPTKTRLGLLLREVHDGEYYHTNLDAVSIGPTPNDYDPERYTPTTVRNPRNEFHNGLWMQGFRISCQGEVKNRPRGVYAWRYGFHEVFSIDQHEADAMSQTFRTIERRLKRLQDRFGWPPTYGQYVLRVANAIGADCIVRTIRGGGWHSESEYSFLNLDEGGGYVDGLIREWQKPESQQAIA